jgi:outer membrane protein OmpA-like peptidoglycan-associated protein
MGMNAGRAAGAAVIAAAAVACGISACGIAGLSSPAARQKVSPPISVTDRVPPSAFVAVVGGTIAGQSLSWLVFHTARPREDLDILRAGLRPLALLRSSSPPPVTVRVAGKPVPPGRGATGYLWGAYRKSLKSWNGTVSAEKQKIVERTHAATSAWAHELAIPTTVTGADASSYIDPSSLADEAKLASAAMAGLDQQAGDLFGDHRVILLYVPDLGGFPHVAELAGDDVIVVTPYLPSAARVSTAQAKLLDAGAARATVLGPEATAAQIASLVSAGLSQKVITETLSGSILFVPGSSELLSSAGRVLAGLLAPLRHHGVIAVINGYAYRQGNSLRDYNASLTSAAVVARYLEDHGIPASSLVVVGHGASHLVTMGSRTVTIGAQDSDSRVLVAIDEP